MPLSPSKDVYVFKKRGYVLPKKDATISGYDSQSAQGIFIVPDVEG